MAARILDGKALAAELRGKIAIRSAELGRTRGITPGLAVILVGDDPASQVYVRNKEEACAEAGIRSQTIRMAAETSLDALLEVISRLNADRNVHGILVQLPLPPHLDENAVLAAIRPEKDVDGFHTVNAGLLFQGRPGAVPCTPAGIMMLLRQTGLNLSGMEATVIGRSRIVGRPVSMLLLNESCTVTMCHSRTKDLASHTRRADIVISAVGKPGLITAEMVREGAVVIDVGISRVDGKVTGDVDFLPVAEKASWITPVPGGVGPMTIAMLLSNTLQAAEQACEAQG